MNNLAWYMNLYYKFRDYPLSQLNSSYKSNELKSVYNGILKKLFLLFELDNRRDEQIEGIISKNNYNHMLNKKASAYLEQEEIIIVMHTKTKFNSLDVEPDLKLLHSRLSFQSNQNQIESNELHSNRSSRWLKPVDPKQQNIDVFYELMIKMIRISLRRLTISIFAIDKYCKNLSKETLLQIDKNSEQYKSLKLKINGQSIVDHENINANYYPSSIEQLKFQFLKYCIKCKVYNNPKVRSQGDSEDSFSSSEVDSKGKLKSKLKIQIPLSPIHDNDIQELILKVSGSQTSIFNKIIDLYFQNINKNEKSSMKIAGIKDITRAIFQMSLGTPSFQASKIFEINKNIYRKNIFDETGEYDKQSKSLSNNNLLLATWFDLILFKESPQVLLELIQELVSLQEKQGYLESVGVSTPNLTQPENRQFYFKILSYLHLLILNSTKNIFIQSLCKINYLLVIIDDVIGDGINNIRHFSQIKLKKYQVRQVDGGKLIYQDIKMTYDCKEDKYIWKKQALYFLFNKWKIIANVITQVCVKNRKAFFAQIFEECAQLLDKQLSLQVELIQLLMKISSNITLQKNITQINLIPNDADLKKCEKTTRLLNQIIKQIIGFDYGFAKTSKEEENDNLSNIKNIINTKFQNSRHRQSPFSNQEQNTEELSKWNEIINKNIYIYTEYKANLELITKIFKNNSLYVALWFIRFHNQTQVLLKKIGINKIQQILCKFNIQLPIIWQSMTNDKEQKYQESRFKRHKKNNLRTRVSSIKQQNILSISLKKTIVLNFMLKAQLELYSHYMLVSYLKKERDSQLIQKEDLIKLINSKPTFLNHQIIKNLLLFSLQNESNPSQFELVPSLFTKQSQKPRQSLSSKLIKRYKSTNNIECFRTLKNIEKNQFKINNQIQDLKFVISHLERPINIDLDLKNKWKENFRQKHKIEYLGEIYDYIKYINEINYLYEFWGWVYQPQSDIKTANSEKISNIQLLKGNEYKQDIDKIDSYFQYFNIHNQDSNQTQKNQEQTKIIQQRSQQMIKCIKLHNKQLYMINQTILEGEHYYKLIGENLLGRNQNYKFKRMIEMAIGTYKNSKREQFNRKLREMAKENLQFIRRSSKDIQFEDYEPEIKQLSVELIQSVSKKQTQIQQTTCRYEFTPQYYKVFTKIFRVNCLIASLQIDNSVYKNIKNHLVLSRQRLKKLVVIGNKFYNKLQILLATDKGEENQSQFEISQHILMRTKNIYEKKILIFLISIINLNYRAYEKTKRYERNSVRRDFTYFSQEDTINYKSVLQRYSQILKNFIYSKIKENIKRLEDREIFETTNKQTDRKQKSNFNICSFLEDILGLSLKQDEFGQQSLLLYLEVAMENQSNVKFNQQIKKEIENLTEDLQVYHFEEKKVEYLKKKLSYLLMREMYFTLNYDNDFLTLKSMNSKRNYQIYEERILNFYQKLLELDYECYIVNKNEELKNRSIHLTNYDCKYESYPPILDSQKQLNQLISCLFNQLLIMHSTSIQFRMFTRKHESNNKRTYRAQELFQQYCSSQYHKEDQNNPLNCLKVRESINENDNVLVKSRLINRIQGKRINSSQKGQQKRGILVFSSQKYKLCQTIKIYLQALTDYSFSSKVQARPNESSYLSKNETLTEAQILTLKSSYGSLIKIMRSQLLQNINNAKCNLIRINLISNVQKLYINIDVRHKVFESFKDQILNYEMQKAKIYHQYMDYIRGLKLDVYSHLAGEQSLSYIKILKAVKLYRLNAKKKQLQKRVSQQFEKNLKKWNQGIQKNLEYYEGWLKSEEEKWNKYSVQFENEKSNLLDIYQTLMKELKRQNKNLRKKMISCPKLNPSKQQINQIKSSQVPKQVQTLVKKSINKKKISFFKRSGEEVRFACDFEISSKNDTQINTKKRIKNEKITHHSRSSTGLRGLSMKYEVPSLHTNTQICVKGKKETPPNISRSKVSFTSINLKMGKRNSTSKQRYSYDLN